MHAMTTTPPTDDQDPQGQPDSPFGRVFAAYSSAFKSRDFDGLRKAFQPDAAVRVHDRRSNERLKITPQEFFTRLYGEIGDAEFKVETLKARFADGYLFADGTWITPEGRGLLRAADLFSAVEDGRIASLTVVWTHATTV
jgi:hypothetical protein